MTEKQKNQSPTSRWELAARRKSQQHYKAQLTMEPTLDKNVHNVIVL